MRRRKRNPMASYAKGKKPYEHKKPLLDEPRPTNKIWRIALLGILVLLGSFGLARVLLSPPQTTPQTVTDAAPQSLTVPPQSVASPVQQSPQPITINIPKPATTEPLAFIEVDAQLREIPPTPTSIVSSPPPQPITESVVKPDKSTQLLTRARRQIADKRLTTPADDSAYATYQQLRTSHPAAAKDLLEEIISEYLSQVRRNIINNQLSAAQAGYRKMLDIAPTAHPAVGLAREEIINAWLTRAERQMYSRRYLTPEHDNANTSYRTVLSWEPENALAQNGLARIADAYAELAANSFTQGDIVKTRQFVERGLQVAPTHAELLQRRQQLQTLPPLVSPVTTEEQLLAQAEQQLKADRLSQPPGNNAYETYRQVLQQFPDHPEAQAGLQAVANRYAQLAQADYALGLIQSSLSILNEGLAIFPQHDGMRALKQRIVQQLADVSP